MLVLAAVPDVQFHKLRRAAGSRFNVAQVSTWDDVLTSIRGRPVELAVVDPLLSGQARSQEIERLRVLFPSLPLMLYTTLTPRTAGVLLALGQRGIQHAVFANYDDHPSRLREVLGQEEARSSSRQLLDQLGDALAPLPSELRWVLEEALRSPGEVQTVGQVAVRARVDRRTCERWFTRVGLPSPALPLRGAGAVRAPPAAGSGLYDRGRGETAGLRADQDSAIARARVPRAHGRRNAPVPRLERGIGARGPALSHPARGPGLRFMSATPRTVLVVDDEAPLRRVLERSLSLHGLRVIGAGSAETAYELLAAEQPDALLLDIHLPTMSGLALYLAIVHRWPVYEGRIAIMTGDAEAEEVRTWLERHQCIVIRKPFNLREVTDWLTAVFQIGEERAQGGAEA